MPGHPAHDSFHPAAGHQLAQATAPGGAAPIGRVDTLSGTVTAQHVDGTVETLTQGASVYARDLVATNAGAKVALVFADKTTFALGESGQMRLDEMIYDPAHKDGKLALSMLKGAFAFVSGDIASTQADAMTVRTPVGTIGIRGTAVEGKVAADGSSTFGAVHDPSGAHSTIVFTNGAGTTVVTEDFSITVQSFFNAPSSPFASPGGAAGELAALMSIASGIASSINPGGSAAAGPAGPVGPLPGQALQNLAPGEPVIHVGLSEEIGPQGQVTIGFTVSETTTDVTQDQLQQPPVYTTVPPPPPPDTEGDGVALGPYVGQVDPRNDFTGTPHADLFDFTTHPDSLKSGDFINGAGGNDTLAALFDKPFAIDSTLQIINVPNIEITLGGGANTLDALGIVSGFSGPSTISVAGSGSLTVTDLQVSLDGHEMTGALIATAIPISGGGSITIEGGTADDSLTGAGYGQGDFLSYAHALTGVTVDFATGTAIHGGSTDTIAGFDGVIGSAFDDNINVSLSGGGHSITVEGGGGDNTLTGSLSDNDFLSYAEVPSGVSATFANGSGTVDNGLGGTDIFSGFNGIILNFGNVAIDGTADIVTVSGLANVITSANGADTIDAMGGGFDTITMGNGADSLTLSGIGFVATVGDGADTIGANGGFDTITVGNGADVLNLNGVVYSVTTSSTSPGADTILGGASFDTIVAYGNNDLISLSGGVVSITVDDGMGGGSGETISVGLGFDTIVGIGDDHFSIAATGGVVSVTADGTGDDSIVVGGGFDTVSVGSGSDTISVIGAGDLPVVLTATGDDSFDLFSFGPGITNATIGAVGILGDDTIATSTQDSITFTGSDDSLTLASAGSGSTITVAGFDDAITVVTGGLTIIVDGDDRVSLASGDTLLVNGDVPLVATLNGDDVVTALGGGNATITENFGDDTITTGSGTDSITLGDDSLFGGFNHVAVGGGNDTIIDNFGDDTIVAGNGNDSIVLAGNCGNSSGGFNLISVGSGNNTIIDGFGDDTITAGSGNDSIELGSAFSFGGFNLIVVGSGNDTITDSFGSDTVVIGSGNGNDSISIACGDNFISGFVAGGSGGDTISASGDFNTIIGGAGVNNLYGGGGADDVVSYAEFPTAITVDLTDGTGTVAHGNGTGNDDTISGFGELMGTGLGDTVSFGGSNDVLSISGVAEVVVTAAGTGDNISLTVVAPIAGDSVPALGAHSLFDFSDANMATLALDIGGTQNITITGVAGGGGLTADQFDLAPAFYAGSGPSPVTDLVLENGTYNLTFGGLFDAPVHVMPGDDTGILTDNTATEDTDHIVLDYTNLGGPTTVTVDAFNGASFNSDQPDVVSGFGPGGAAAQFNTFSSVTADPGSELVITSAATGIVGIDLTNGVIYGIGGESCGTAISGFTAIDYQGIGAITIQDNGGDSLTVAGGNDTILLSGGGDVVTAGSGNDSIASHDGGQDAISVGTGNDTITFYGFHDLITAGSSSMLGNTVIAQDNPTVGGGGSDTILVGDGTYTITVTAGSDSITALDGSVTVVANDTQGGGGNDTIMLGNGHDAISVAAPVNSITVGSGDDSISPGTGLDTVTAGNGNDTIQGTGNDSITLGSGDDLISTGNGSDTISVGSGNNTVTFGSGTDIITITGPGGGSDNITVGNNTTIVFQNANDSTQNNTAVLNNWTDTSQQIDLSALTSQNTIVNHGSQISVAAAFGADSPGELDFAVVGTNTYLHLASGSGYSAHDLLIDIAGTGHALTVTSGVVHG